MRLNPLRGAALLAIAGVLIASIATTLHPGMDPGNLLAVMPEYAASRSWAAIHLGQYIGYLASAASLIVLLDQLRQRSGSTLALLGLFTAAVTMAAYAANQAVDGVAVQFVSAQWAAAAPAQQAGALQVADAVRHIEQGLSGLVTLNLGLTLGLAGGAILSRRWPVAWLGLAALAVGVGQVVSGALIYFLGFSQHEFGFWMSILLSLWLLALALVLWHAAEAPRAPARQPISGS